MTTKALDTRQPGRSGPGHPIDLDPRPEPTGRHLDETA